MQTYLDRDRQNSYSRWMQLVRGPQEYWKLIAATIQDEASQLKVPPSKPEDVSINLINKWMINITELTDEKVDIEFEVNGCKKHLQWDNPDDLQYYIYWICNYLDSAEAYLNANKQAAARIGNKVNFLCQMIFTRMKIEDPTPDYFLEGRAVNDHNIVILLVQEIGEVTGYKVDLTTHNQEETADIVRIFLQRQKEFREKCGF